MFPQEFEALFRLGAGSFAQEVEFKQDSSIGLIQRKSSFHGSQRVARSVSLVEVSQSQVAVHRRQRRFTSSRPLPARTRLRNLPFVIPQIAEIKIGPRISWVCAQGAAQRSNAVQVVGKTAVGRMPLRLVKKFPREFFLSNLRRVIAQEIPHHRDAVRVPGPADMSGCTIQLRGLCGSL